MSRTTLVVLFAVTLLGFGALLAGGPLLKKPLDPNEDIGQFLRQLEETLHPVPDWERAWELQEAVELAWSRVERRIQFSVEKDDMRSFTDQLVRLKAGIEIEELPIAWEALGLLKATWHRMR